MKFIVYNSLGEIIRAGDCPHEAFSLQAHDGELVMEGECDIDADAVDVASQTVLRGGRPVVPPPELTYAQQRKAAYPALGDQLDMLWHAMDNYQAPRMEPFYSQIKAVKDQFPKPNT